MEWGTYKHMATVLFPSPGGVRVFAYARFLRNERIPTSPIIRANEA